MSENPGNEHQSCMSCPIFGTSVFSKVKPEMAQRMGHARDRKKFRRGDIIFSRGDKCEGVYCIRSGVVKLYSEIPDDREHLVRLLGPGDFFGVASAVSDSDTCHVTAKVVEDTQICFYRSDLFRSFISGSPALAESVNLRLWKRLRNTEEIAGRMAGRSVRERMALTLLSLSRQFGAKDPDGTLINVRLSREEIASLAGTVVESAVRHLSEFKEEGLIGADGRKLIVIKADALEKISG